MTNLFDRLPLALRARASRGSTTRRSGDRQTPLGSRSGGSLSRGSRNGLTLIEMLVALAVTLVMMAAVVNLFANISGSIRNRRAAIETGAQLRQVRQRLAMDLNGATCRGTTWQRPEANQGYIEIIEGECTDKAPTNLLPGPGQQIDTTVSMIPSSQKILDPTSSEITDALGLGDWDDILALTVQSEKAPFTAQVDGVMVESSLAEVVWFATENQPGDPGETGMRKVYRRALLIAPWLGPWNSKPNNVSVHWDPSIGTGGQWVANTLGDLTKRENRFTRAQNSSFPHPLRRGELLTGSPQDHLVLDNALAFDLRVFDPGAPLYDNAGTIVEPSDLGWVAAYGPIVANEASNGFFDNFVSQGAYVDMGYCAPMGLTGANPLDPNDNIPPNRPLPAPQAIRPVFAYQSMLAGNGGGSNYDTWSYHYENDGIDQDPGNATMPNIIDQGANGLDDNNANGVDDMGERETAPPYDVPLRGIKAILRVYEPDARQIRESSVTHSFKQ
jgi:prepilin-type N-terminal cleavage/methylation domain-containing protein